MEATPALKTSPLDALHHRSAARFAEFGGWDMPISFGTGTVAEHIACREGAAIFDVSHLGTIEIRGDGALETLQATLSNDLSKVAVGRAQYSLLLDDSDASVLDDVIVWWLGPDWFQVMPNATNTDRVAEALLRPGLQVRDITDQRALLALQGPAARAVLAAIWPAASAVPRFHASCLQLEGTTAVVAGTGYTGEDGLELALVPEIAARVWPRLVSAGAAPAGLAARDTLRLEAGLPLHGHELGPGITPLQARLDWVVGWGKPHFLGREAVLRERCQGPARVLWGLLGEGRQPLRAGQAVHAMGPGAGGPGAGGPGSGPSVVLGPRLGVLTSGNFSPVLRRGIGLGFLGTEVKHGQRVLVAGRRGTVQEAVVMKPPFVRPGTGAKS
ncbi:MAG: glycine cleavage system aminomethyltransferase GcvT [Acidimicrobiales bacterium]